MQSSIPFSLRLYRFAVSLLIVLALALCMVIAAALTWVALEPRSLKTFIPVIESALSPQGATYKTKIDGAYLVWDGWEQPMDIRLHQVEIRTPEGQIFASFPQVSMGLDLMSLLVGRVTPHSIIIQKPILSLYQHDDKSLTFGVKNETSPAISPEAVPGQFPQPDNSAVLAAFLRDFLDHNGAGQFSKLDLIAIREADLTIGNAADGVFFTADQFNLSLTRGHNVFRVGFSFGMAYGDARSSVKGELRRKRGVEVFDARVELHNIMPAMLSKLFVGETPVSGVELPISAVVLGQLKPDGTPINTRFSVNAGAGKLLHARLEEPLDIGSLQGEGSYDFITQQLLINRVAMQVEGASVNLNGAAVLKEGQESISANGAMTNAKGDDVRKYWPVRVSPMSREWVTENISGGTIPQATIRLAIPAGALALPALPDDSVDARLTMQGAKVRYLPDHPPLVNIKGSVRVTGQTLTAIADSATTLKNVQVSKGQFFIADLNADNPHIKMSFDVKAEGEDISTFMALPRFAHMKPLNLADKSLVGSASGHVKLAFDFFAPKDAQGNSLDPDIGYSIAGQVQNAGVKNFMQRFDIAQASGSMEVDNDGVSFKGSGTVNGVPMREADVRYSEQAKDGIDTAVAFKTAETAVESLRSFGVAALPGFGGTLSAEGTLRSGDSRTEIEASGDVTNATIAIAEVGLKKPAQMPATLAVDVLIADGKPVEIRKFDLSANDIKAKGSASVGADFSKDGRVNFSELKSGKSDCALVYENKNGARVLELSGASFDASHLMQGNSDFSFKHFPATDLKADIAKLILGERRELRDLKGSLSCSQQRCERADLQGFAGSKPFRFRILNESGKRTLNIASEDAGGFLQALDLMEGIEGGSLTVEGRYNERPQGSELAATLRIQDYVVGDAPVLAKLLTLASLTGIVDTLQGKGIAFKRLQAPFTLADDVITIKDAKTNGSAMGMTADGTIRFPGTVLDLKGTVVPSYTANTVLGNVPIVGQVLTGGNKESGIFAARYNITGQGGKADVSVNPLSMLTPGFLRGLFDVFEGSPGGKATEEKQTPAYPSEKR